MKDGNKFLDEHFRNAEKRSSSGGIKPRAATWLLLALVVLLAASNAWGQSDDSTQNSPGVAPPTSTQATSPFFQSVPSNERSPGVLKLTLLDAINRGLKQNLGLLLSDDSTLDARGERWQALSHLLPDLRGTVSEHYEQVDLASLGFSPSIIPGVPAVIGPFGYADARAFYTQPVLDLHAIENIRAQGQNVRAAQFSYKDARELVVLAVGLNYLQAISQAARVDTAKAQVDTAQALYDQASDQEKAGTSPDIDVLRALVELQTRQQQLIAAQNDFDKQKLAVARVVGLPTGQEFQIADKEPYDEFAPASLDEELQRAYLSRSDYLSAQAKVKQAQFALKAAKAQYLPSLSLDADYGDVGMNFGNSHGTVDVVGTLKVPIFDAGKTHGDVLRAEATLKQNEQQMENVRAQVDQDVRDALLDLRSAAQQVKVAKSNIDLASQTLDQAKDRFSAGVTNNIEVVQAQESVATANESYISSLFTYNYAKISLARAIGIAEQGVTAYLKGK